MIQAKYRKWIWGNVIQNSKYFILWETDTNVFFNMEEEGNKEAR